MAQFNQLNTGNIYSTIAFNGSTLPQENILNFIGTQISVADDPSNHRTNVTFPDFLELAGGTMLGNLILNADPTTALQAVTKQYVDSLSAGLSPRTSCRVATTGALTVTYSNGTSGVGATVTNAGTQLALSIDSVNVAVNDRVLIKDQAAQAQNGIYTVTNVGSGSTNWVMTRATDYNTASANGVVEGSYTVISEGTVNAANLYVETGQGPFTIGTTAIVFSAFNSAANINVIAPITKNGNTIALTTPLAATYGGTGVANSNTITLAGAIVTAGAFTTAGSFGLTLTATGSTNVTLPVSGTLVNTAVTTLSSLVSIGTVNTGIWNGTLISPTYGGTGINNGSKTITLGGNLITSGAFNSTFTITADTSVTFPTSGTLATTSQLPTFPVSLANGGTGAALVANNGGIFYSSASAGAILAGTATANQALLSGTSSAPAWSTATYPATTTINQLLYSSSANVIAGLATANSGVLITSSGGVPSISSTLPSAVQGNIVATGALASGSLAAGFTVVTGALGGTGVANSGKTITLGGNFTTSGAFASTLTLTNTTTVTLPVSGTLLANTNNLSDVSSAATSRTNLGVDVCLYQVVSQTFTASGTYTPTSGMVYCIVEIVGGGGGGGGTAITSAGQYAIGGGGGGGEYGRALYASATIGASKTVTIGGGGAGGVAGNNTGTTGGTTSLVTLLTAIGGTGGSGGAASASGTALGGAGGTGGTGGDFHSSGAPGGFAASLTVSSIIFGGQGGSSHFGGGALSSFGAAGITGGNYGSGGSGASQVASSGALAGGNGAQGLVYITEFIKRS